ncbi:hypothetical protein F4821DRAFT_236219 [Hypoxylon rubiginosum]|uniref:Uncharacterized protein n=1 Tax=Hypoxylon rubiginosum TaxID=110542 RepID=A0ACC0D3T2_9PEZI|nr:hypothetical protein F4821DRAFT_236219 [Hypoxylon rubiginosum]
MLSTWEILSLLIFMGCGTRYVPGTRAAAGSGLGPTAGSSTKTTAITTPFSLSVTRIRLSRTTAMLLVALRGIVTSTTPCCSNAVLNRQSMQLIAPEIFDRLCHLLKTSDRAGLLNFHPTQPGAAGA